jgi:hypothetical protein
MPDRCPHCASTKIADGICFACARNVNEAPDLPRLEGLEETAVGTSRVPKRKPESAETDERVLCLYCGVHNPGGRSLCLACGQRL